MAPSEVNGTWDQLFVTNPAPFIYPNSSALLIYKAGRTAAFPGMYEGVAFAEHYLGPYTRLLVLGFDPSHFARRCCPLRHLHVFEVARTQTPSHTNKREQTNNKSIIFRIAYCPCQL